MGPRTFRLRQATEGRVQPAPSECERRYIPERNLMVRTSKGKADAMRSALYLLKILKRLLACVAVVQRLAAGRAELTCAGCI